MTRDTKAHILHSIAANCQSFKIKYISILDKVHKYLEIAAATNQTVQNTTQNLTYSAEPLLFYIKQLQHVF